MEGEENGLEEIGTNDEELLESESDDENDAIMHEKDPSPPRDNI
jgi:hypothetical protein